MNNLPYGKYGEDLACQYLQKLGWEIVERNFRIRGGEIDIIAKDGETLVYVEVKTRSSDYFGRPEESVNFRKLKFLERAAKFYRNNRTYLKLPEQERIDVISVKTSIDTPMLEHFKNAGFV
jgi:putative endonuclease